MLFTYDAAGNPTKKQAIDATGSTVATTTDAFDVVNRLTQTAYNPGTPTAATVSRAYDVNSDPTNLTDPSGATTTSYDAATRVSGITGPSANATYGYDAASNPMSVNVPSGAYSYSWRPDNLLASRVGGDTSTFAYDLAGHPTSLTDGAGRVTQTTYSRGGLPLEVQLRPSSTAPPDADMRVR